MKKEIAGETWLGYCPFTVCVGSRYNKLYRDTTGMGTAAGATTRLGLGYDTAEYAPRYGLETSHDTAGLCKGRVAAHRACGSTCAHGLARGSRDTKIVLWLRGDRCIAI